MPKALYLTLLVAAVGLGACTFNRVVHEYPPGVAQEPAPAAGDAYTYYAESMPPVVQSETVPPQPYPDWVWIEGYWHWNGTEWVWIPGYWSPPLAGMVYVPPYYDWYGGACIYIVGHWDWPSNLPAGSGIDHPGGHRPPIARIPRVRDHRRFNRHPVGRHPGRSPHDSPPPRYNERVPARRGDSGASASSSGFRPARVAPRRSFAPPSSTPPRTPPSPSQSRGRAAASNTSRGSYAPPSRSSSPSRGSYSPPSRSSSHSSHSRPSSSRSSSSSHSSASRSSSSRSSYSRPSSSSSSSSSRSSASRSSSSSGSSASRSSSGSHSSSSRSSSRRH